MTLHPPLKAHDILGLLEGRHRKDLTVAEACTARGGYRIDFWAMRYGWSRPQINAYEIKVNRSDWLRDQKFDRYAAYCNALWVAAPRGVVEVQELPEGVGLVEASKNGKRLMTKRRAALHPIIAENEAEIYKAILMNRAKIVAPNQRHEPERETKSECLAYWRNWLKEREEGKKLGWRVAQAVRLHVNDVEAAASQAVRKAEDAEQFRAHLAKLGITWNKGDWSWDVIRQIDQMAGGLPVHFDRVMSDARRAIVHVEEMAEKIRKGTG